ncbi:MAG: aminotransferase class I/II-fold pyridoxal phosphate-dependent enzyme [Erysipelotrichaceae bacterium]|nr:aminotransferase class I/II-fold pyridoxal phosphate-dependent enzyme [Erysipelotrichaceae bacterium]
MSHKFQNDYSVLASPRILEALSRYGQEENVPYGLDRHSAHAASLIKEKFGAPNGSVYFLSGGTQTNLVFLSAALKPFEAVISLGSGHINVHETGAVEGTGHKIVVVPGKEGKMYPEDIEKVMATHRDMHMVKPRLAYISNSTEIGTIYTRDELRALRECCDRHGLLLFIDGARLGSALTSKQNDVPPSLIGAVADGFYVGGTKNGLLFGEALVVNNPSIAEGFAYHIKNRGAMLAKGYAVGIQFEAAFEDGLYFELAEKTNRMADRLKEGLKRLGLPIMDSPTNQVFVTLPKGKAEAFIAAYGCELWEDQGEKMTIRFVTSFATEEKDVVELLDFASSLI